MSGWRRATRLESRTAGVRVSEFGVQDAGLRIQDSVTDNQGTRTRKKVGKNDL
jgi:hypothetical protein